KHVTVGGVVSAAGPHLPAGDQPSAVDTFGRSPYGRKVRSCLGLAQTQAEEILTARDAGKDAVAEVLRAVAKNRGTDLTVGDPVRGYRRPRAKQFLGDGQPVDVGVFTAPVFTRPGHTDEPALGEFLGERRVVRTQPGIASRREPLRIAPLAHQVTNLRPEFYCAQRDDVRARVNSHR